MRKFPENTLVIKREILGREKAFAKPKAARDPSRRVPVSDRAHDFVRGELFAAWLLVGVLIISLYLCKEPLSETSGRTATSQILAHSLIQKVAF